MLQASGFPVGVPDEPYDDEVVALLPGDRLYIHSDGLTEAMSAAGELFGVTRTLDVLAARGESLDVSLRHLSAAVRGLTGSADRNDDETALAIERLPPGTRSGGGTQPGRSAATRVDQFGSSTIDSTSDGSRWLRSGSSTSHVPSGTAACRRR